MIFFIFIFIFQLLFLSLFVSFSLFLYSTWYLILISYSLFYIQDIWPWQTIFNATHKCVMWLEKPPPLNSLYTYGMWLSNHSCMGYTCVETDMSYKLNTWFAAFEDGKTLTSFTSVHNSLIAFDKMEIQSKEEGTINSRCCKHFSIYLPWSNILLKIQNNSNIALLIF